MVSPYGYWCHFKHQQAQKDPNDLKHPDEETFAGWREAFVAGWQNIIENHVLKEHDIVSPQEFVEITQLFMRDRCIDFLSHVKPQEDKSRSTSSSVSATTLQQKVLLLMWHQTPKNLPQFPNRHQLQRISFAMAMKERVQILLLDCTAMCSLMRINGLRRLHF